MSDREPTPRPGGRSGMSVSGTLSIIVAAVAVILGFLILRDINDSGDGASGGGGDSTETSTTLPGGANNTEPTTPDGSTTAPTTPVLKPYTVIVANAAKVNGAAAAMTTALQGISVQTLPGVNSNVTAAEATTTIFYNPTYELEAQDLATKMGVTTAPVAMPSPPPIASDASLGAANLLVQLGTDLAGKPLPTGGATAETTAPPST